MQNKGFVKVFALLLTLVCVFYLSFSFVTTYQMNKVDEITKTQGEEAGAHYGFRDEQSGVVGRLFAEGLSRNGD